MADDVQVKICQQDIIRLDLEIKAFIQDIKCCKSLDVLQTLNRNIQNCILDLKERIEDLERFGKEQDRETDTIGILKDVEKLSKQLNSTQKELRCANLSTQIAIDRMNKEQLLSGTGGDKGDQHVSSKEGVARTSINITEQLMSVSRRMSAHIKHSDETISTLATSSQQIDETRDEFKSMTGHIQHSRKLLTRYGRREFTDKILILLAMIFFFAAVLYIIKKRLFTAAEVTVMSEPGVS